MIGTSPECLDFLSLSTVNAQIRAVHIYRIFRNFSDHADQLGCLVRLPTLAECGNRAKVTLSSEETGCGRKDVSFLSYATRGSVIRKWSGGHEEPSRKTDGDTPKVARNRLLNEGTLE